jgi:hypothetical protein
VTNTLAVLVRLDNSTASSSSNTPLPIVPRSAVRTANSDPKSNLVAAVSKPAPTASTLFSRHCSGPTNS